MRARLLDEEGGLTPQLEACLGHIFAKYCIPPPRSTSSGTLLVPPKDAVWTEEALDKWAIDTNGQPLAADAKEDIADNLLVDEQGNLLFEGLLQLYALQTSNDEEETWKDLGKHGFDRRLQLQQ
ncbi:hypothetical protein PIIN_06743 [Serendipita indica DSM 11827]|uniref:Uncharacterized protein n=1 Tax=Serendipita indica (strain DSM 11827) TaxID=1109443 RepID=G4TNB4_SERID|nr:hypothetical protein PIIN_06743 [Serendipita indica DSM 11827]